MVKLWVVRNFENNIWAMVTGDANKDGIVRYNGTVNDKNSILGEVGLFMPNNIVLEYKSNDINMVGGKI